jgi:hypothetical protein
VPRHGSLCEGKGGADIRPGLGRKALEGCGWRGVVRINSRDVSIWGKQRLKQRKRVFLPTHTTEEPFFSGLAVQSMKIYFRIDNKPWIIAFLYNQNAGLR